MSVSLQEKNGTYYAVFRVKDFTGSTKQKWVSTKIPAKRGNKREALNVAQHIAYEYTSSSVVSYPSVLFVDWIGAWLQQKKSSVDIITYQGYQSYYDNHIKPWFDSHNKPLGRITAQDLQEYYNAKANPADGSKGLSGSTLHKHHVIIDGALQDAVKKRIIQYNPASAVSLPKSEKYTGSFLTVEQIGELLEAVKGTILEGIVTVTVFYGLRRSEAVGLKWSAVNFEAGTFTIQSTVVRFSDVVEKNTTKNKASKRTYPMTPDVKNLLLSIRTKQEEAKALMGNCYVDSGYVFTWPDVRMLTPDYVTSKFGKILKENNLPHVRFHDLRHTTASLLISKGYDLKRVSEWLGHSNISTTANVYGHLVFEAKIDTADTLSELISI